MRVIQIVDSKGERTVELMAAFRRQPATEVLQATSGLFALTLMERTRPDLVLTAAILEDMTAIELVTIIRQDPNLAGTRVVVLGDIGYPAAQRFDAVLSQHLLTEDITSRSLRLFRPRADEPSSSPTTRDNPATDPKAMIQGLLWFIGLEQVLEVLGSGSKTGCLLLTSEERAETIFLFEGRVVLSKPSLQESQSELATIYSWTKENDEVRFRFDRMTKRTVATQSNASSITVGEALGSMTDNNPTGRSWVQR